MKSWPCPKPPCSATTSGQRRLSVAALRHVEREGAARQLALVRAAPVQAHGDARRRIRVELGQARVATRLGEEAADRRQRGPQRIEPLLGPAVGGEAREHAGRDLGGEAGSANRRAASCAASAAETSCSWKAVSPFGHPGLAEARERLALPVSQRSQRFAQGRQQRRVQAPLHLLEGLEQRDGGGAGRRERAPVGV